MVTVEVYDEAELAEILERSEREAGVASCRTKVRQDEFNETEIVLGLTCDECEKEITTDQQRAILRIVGSCTTCPACRREAEEQKSHQQKLRAIRGY